MHTIQSLAYSWQVLQLFNLLAASVAYEWLKDTKSFSDAQMLRKLFSVLSTFTIDLFDPARWWVNSNGTCIASLYTFALKRQLAPVNVFLLFSWYTTVVIMYSLLFLYLWCVFTDDTCSFTLGEDDDLRWRGITGLQDQLHTMQLIHRDRKKRTKKLSMKKLILLPRNKVMCCALSEMNVPVKNRYKKRIIVSLMHNLVPCVYCYEWVEYSMNKIIWLTIEEAMTRHSSIQWYLEYFKRTNCHQQLPQTDIFSSHVTIPLWLGAGDFFSLSLSLSLMFHATPTWSREINTEECGVEAKKSHCGEHEQHFAAPRSLTRSNRWTEHPLLFSLAQFLVLYICLSYKRRRKNCNLSVQRVTLLPVSALSHSLSLALTIVHSLVNICITSKKFFSSVWSSIWRSNMVIAMNNVCETRNYKKTGVRRIASYSMVNFTIIAVLLVASIIKCPSVAAVPITDDEGWVQICSFSTFFSPKHTFLTVTALTATWHSLASHRFFRKFTDAKVIC